MGILECQWGYQFLDGFFYETPWGYGILDGGFGKLSRVAMGLPEKSVGFTFNGTVTGGRVLNNRLIGSPVH